MKPVRITVSELFGEYDYDLPVYEGVTYVHSPNGMGKSTLMKLVKDMLSGDTEAVASVPFRRLGVQMDDGSELVATRDPRSLSVEVVLSKAREKVRSENMKVMDCTYIGPERLYIPASDGHMKSAFFTILDRLQSDIRRAVEDTELPEVPGENIPDGDLERRFRDIGARLDFIKLAGPSPKIPLGFKFPPTRYDITQNQDGYNGLARSLGAWCDRYYGFAENVVVLRDIINTVFVNKTVSFNSNGDLEVRMDTSGTAVPVEKFSSGEKHIVIMFYTLLFATRSGSLVIIDEPEVSLHVTWQHHLGKLFGDV